MKFTKAELAAARKSIIDAHKRLKLPTTDIADAQVRRRAAVMVVPANPERFSTEELWRFLDDQRRHRQEANERGGSTFREDEPLLSVFDELDRRGEIAGTPTVPSHDDARAWAVHRVGALSKLAYDFRFKLWDWCESRSVEALRAAADVTRLSQSALVEYRQEWTRRDVATLWNKAFPPPPAQTAANHPDTRLIREVARRINALREAEDPSAEQLRRDAARFFARWYGPAGRGAVSNDDSAELDSGSSTDATAVTEELRRIAEASLGPLPRLRS